MKRFLTTPNILKFIVFLIVVYFIKSTFIFIPPGFVGAVYDMGRGVLPTSMKEGLNLAIPFWQRVELFDSRIQEYTMASGNEAGLYRGDDALEAPTADGQRVSINATVLFKVDKEKVPTLWKEIGIDYQDKVLRPVARSQIRMVISRYTATEIYSERRQEAEAVMTKEVAEIMAQKYIYVDKVLLRTVTFSPEYSKAIEDKVVAEQRVKQAEFEVKEASQRAQAKIAEAKGLAEAQALQKASLTSEYLQLEAIKKWDGQLPQVVGSGGTPFINLPLK